MKLKVETHNHHKNECGNVACASKDMLHGHNVVQHTAICNADELIPSNFDQAKINYQMPFDGEL